jgi:hypothetical protein
MAEKTLKQLYDDLRRTAGFAVVTGTLDSKTFPAAEADARARAVDLVREALAAQLHAAFSESAAAHFDRLSAIEARFGNHLQAIEGGLGAGLGRIGDAEARLNGLAIRIETLGETLARVSETREPPPASPPPPPERPALDQAALAAAIAPLAAELKALRGDLAAIEKAAASPSPVLLSEAPSRAPAPPPLPSNEALGQWIAALVAALIGGILLGLYGHTIADHIIAFFHRSFG